MTATAKKGLGCWAAAAGVGVAYLTIFTTVTAFATRSGSSEYGPTLAAILSIALFRRLLRLRGEAATEQNFKAGLVKYYLASYWSALWRWALIFVGLAIAAAFLTNGDPKAFGASMAVMVIGSIFAPDVPYRVHKCYLNGGPSSFRERNLGWIAFLTVMVILYGVNYVPALTKKWLSAETNTARASPSTAKQVFAAAQNSVVMVESFNELGIPLGQGSGVILGRSSSKAEKGYYRLLDGSDILTNFHVIKNANYVVITTKQGSTHLGAVVYFNESQDLALLRGPLDAGIDDTRIANEASVGERVFTISNPQGLGWTLSEGIVSRMPSTDNPLIQFTAPVSPGSSGGAVYNEQCDLVGIVTAILQDSQNINFATYLKPLATTIGAMRQRAAFPFSIVDANDWKAGYFLTDESDRGQGKQYATRVAFNSKYEEQTAPIGAKMMLELEQAQTSAEDREVFSRADERRKKLNAQQEEFIGMWRSQYPNDPDAAVANIKMLVSLGRIEEAGDAAKSALRDFPLNMDVVYESCDLLKMAKRPDLVPELLSEVEDLWKSAESETRQFDDVWSNDSFEAKAISRSVARDSRLTWYRFLCKVYGFRSDVANGL